MQKSLKKYFPLFVLPTLVAFLIAFLVPFVMGIYLSFTRFTTIMDAKWCGLNNYIKAFSNMDFVNALTFTIKFAVLSVLCINVLAFLLALVLTRGLKGTNLFRAVFFMPNLIGGIVLGYIWQLMINGVLLQTVNKDITYSAVYGYWGMIILMNWQMVGYMMIIYIAGIENVPTDLFEAAMIDGATKGQIIRKITIPLVMPSITICTFLTLTNSFKLFDQNLALTGGMPGKKTAMLALDIYNTFYNRIGWEGAGQAKAVIFSIMVALIALFQLRLTRSKEVEN